MSVAAPLAALVEWGDLLEIVWVSLAAGVGVTAAFALAIVGATTMVDFGRDGRHLGAVLSGLLLVVGLVVCTAAIVFGVIAMTSK